MTAIKDPRRLAELLREIPQGGHTRLRTTRDDFGDPDSARLYLRRVGPNYGDLMGVPADAFGMYGAQHPEGYVVVLVSLMDWAPYGCECFESLEELKQRWELD